MRRTPIEECRKHVEKWLGSNRKITHWCKENNISLSTFQNWRKRIKKADEKSSSGPTPPKFFEITSEMAPDQQIEISLNGAVLSVQEGFSEKLLLQCLKVLKEV